MKKTTEWYQSSLSTLEQQLQTDSGRGLSGKRAGSLLNKYGKNQLVQKKQDSILKNFFDQFKDFMIITLLIAAAISFGVSWLEHQVDFIEPAIILAIIIINAILGVVQEAKARHSLEALKNLSAPLALVVRDGEMKQLDSTLLVPGDVIILEAGNLVPADARIISVMGLSIEESTLTGETHPIEKTTAPIGADAVPIAEQKNMAFSGTIVVSGHGKAIVTATGMNTELGHIAGMISEESAPDTPLQKKLSHTGKVLGTVALLICFALFVIGILNKQPVFSMFMTSVSLGVAAIPESLPALVTIMLSLGVERMAKRNAIIRRLPAVETLGSATVICSDKTGTLTENRMTVAEEYTMDSPQKLFTCFALCNHGIDPMEQALLERAAGLSIDTDSVRRKYRLFDELPFDSKRKMMTTFHETGSGAQSITKGAPEIILKRCSHILIGGQVRPLTPVLRHEIDNKAMAYAADALRVLAIACRDDIGSHLRGDKASYERDMTFIGLAGFIDPPRKEAEFAVTKCRQAGIRPVMITGDHKVTASAIAARLGICKSADQVMTGAELDGITDTQLSRVIYKYPVFARVSPAHKVRLVKAFQHNGEVVAMTGDGVNDAPALQKADIGCAMGKSGTDVAKNAADMILMDDNFATIVDAVEEGRGIFQNIKKAVHFLLSCNIGEIMTIFLAILLGKASPLLPVQLLFINLVTDSFPAICLGLEPPERDIMKKPPVCAAKGLFGGGGMFTIIVEGMFIGSLALFAYMLGGDQAGSTMCFAVLSLSQLVHSLNMRSSSSLFQIGFFSNKKLLFSVLLCIAMQCAVITLPALQIIFKTTPLTNMQWLMVAVLALLPIPLVELEKRAG